ncbi:cytochrome ubiquinol oxidase subunit I [Pseudomonas vlassakiae]|jgi:cytochrome bd ubiquinol oxidase subunit I|uniref:Cytochrome ubiquinol oxidase subunit I n=1 Tax=Pseudomonas vlassakiae TaxID=485888 RepID=A0A923K3E2_9PSED|nr:MULTISPECIES: cytochrome ubiquinol oxidase subunit I [Pseudomonas]MBH3409607.1 cytochrome ubiquinol oxidase subunit I [Pseudomonas putida]MBS3186966.1 cytochrome ubiquinol oxidase subunit I [Pseudomonas sp. PCH44]MBV4543325.1 cytochrome ubiquinol oxidase subunit I [Pseudomonas vlassakiae]MCU0123558.1 cytochrome ubiquinol oxidase subunit I [Pseudomonas vlassakiae]PIK75970.1 cytochrome ubiquinol oxidase subunit I [Pseudomonas sp. 382]
MFGIEALELARMQFAFTVSFHILFPAITIGLASYLAVLEGLWLRTDKQVYRDLYHFWSKIFAVNFGMGVVSGLVMAYQFGTNWSRFSEFAGSVTGPLLTYEVLTAFFLEAGFLGVMLFGWNRVGRGLHFFSTCMVALGTLVSTFWILASNSWMHTPQGHAIVDGRVVPMDWFAIVFNPSFPFRLMHMATAAFVATAFFVGASAAWHLLRGRDNPAVRKMLSMAMWMALIVAPVQAVIGDFHGLNTLKHQPVKIAAIEGHWENQPGEPTPLILFGIPDMKAETTHFKIEIPVLGSLILTHSLDKQVPAMKEFPAEDRPNSTIIFWSFRVMVAMGLLMIAAGLWSLLLRRGGKLYSSRPFLHFVMWMGPSGLLAILAGWITTEVGRQPWVVYGLMRTADGVSNHSYAQLGFTLIAFVVVYFALFGTGFAYMMRLVRKGPHTGEGDDQRPGGPGQKRTPARPLSAADEGSDAVSANLSKGN